MLSGKLYNNMIRQELYFKTYITPAQMLTLFSAPVTLVQGQSGIFYVPKATHFRKEAGTAYTLNGSTNLKAQWSNGTAFSQAANAGFLDQTGALTVFAQAASSAASYYSMFSASLLTAINGASLQLTTETADLTVGTGGLFLTILYEQWPMFINFN